MKKDVEYLEMTNPQKNIYNIESFYNGSNINNICGVLLFKDIKKEILEKAVLTFIERNDNFSLRVSRVNSKLYVESKPTVNFIEFNSVCELENFENAFPKTNIPFFDHNLYVATIVKYKNEYRLFVILHHLISDALSLSLMLNGIIELYNLYSSDLPDEKTFPSYIEYIKNYSNYKNSKKYLKDLDYWSSEFENAPNILSLKDNSNISNKSSRHIEHIPKNMLNKIQDFCARYEISEYVFLLSVFSVYFSKVYEKDQFILGTPVLNRTNFKEKQTCGLFINTIPFKVDMCSSNSFLDEIKKVATAQMQSFRHLGLSFQDILDIIHKKYELKQDLYDIVFSYQTSGIKENAKWLHTPTQHESLQIHFKNINNKLTFHYDFLIDVFSLDEIKNIHNRILYIISQVLFDNSICIEDIHILTKKDREKISEFNDTKQSYKSCDIASMFKKSVLKNPNKTALIVDGKHYSYSFIDDYSDKIANYLINENLKNEIIGISSHRNVYLLCAILGVLKSGNAYMPIDPNYPTSRISYMIDNSNCPIVLKTSDVNLNFENLSFIDIDKFSFKNAKPIKNLYISPNSLAYVMYTSGTTGNPKAVTIKHKNVINFANSVNTILNYTNQNVLSVTTMCFDIFVFEIFPTLILSQTIVMANESEQNNPKLLETLINKENVTKVLTTPSRLMLFDSFANLKTVEDYILGGEPLPSNLLLKLQETDSKIYNFYGPTETCVYSAFKDMTNDKTIKVGKPILNTHIYILDKKNNLKPNGYLGEIAIAGDGVGSGYLDVQKTNASFVTLPFAKGKVYKTGDLGYIDENNELVCKGRSDNQVKVHGFRIELNDITNNILKYPGILKCATVVKNLGKDFIVSYYESDTLINDNELKKFLSTYLPHYMIPNIFVKMEQLPLNLNHKIDKNKLPDPVIKTNISSDLDFNFENEYEQLLFDTFLDTLNLKLSRTQDFFEFSIDSLDIIKVQVALLEKGINLNTQNFYATRNICELANCIAKNAKEEKDTSLSCEEIKIAKTVNKDFVKFPNIIELKKNFFNDIYLLGSNGFLGIYLLNLLLEQTNYQIICPIRHDSKYLSDLYKSFFGRDLTSYLNENRLIVKNIDITSDCSFLNNISSNSLLVNCAANVNYYGSYKNFKKINVDLIDNILKYQKKKHFNFIHVSTLGVSGNYLVKNSSNNRFFNENNLYIGQNYKENVYIRTKFEAEKLIYEANQDKCSIFRVGNLTSSSKDGLFQKNYGQNAFLNIILLILKYRMIPNSLLDMYLEFTPVNECAQAIFKLIFNVNINKLCLHIFNNNYVNVTNLISTFDELGYPVNVLNGSDFNKTIFELAHSTNSDILKGMVNDLDPVRGLKFDNTVNQSNYYTNALLENVGFKWSTIDKSYFEKLLSYLTDAGIL